MATSLIKTLLNSNVAKWLIETYNGSSLGGSNRSVKSAIDSLNSNNDGYRRAHVVPDNTPTAKITFSSYNTVALIILAGSNTFYGVYLYVKGYDPVEIMRRQISQPFPCHRTTKQ